MRQGGTGINEKNKKASIKKTKGFLWFLAAIFDRKL